jgi:hypothetical protein
MGSNSSSPRGPLRPAAGAERIQAFHSIGIDVFVADVFLNSKISLEKARSAVMATMITEIYDAL